ncbi:sensor histidine kinase [Micropruina sonneratiae]|uniref:sensor histidine kinase n=1 Tax=Micropruina sonneratiae TaxID=2986940 RepID=UPI0022263B78|nr:histidine kinase [Micropruina sp. KQZ13P-5]MCW3157895.1 histidine kinase [Micropruina sp. KQZ13P-5]
MRANPALPRNASVLIWVPVLLASPLVSLRTGGFGAGGVMLVAMVGAAAVTGVLASWPAPTAISVVAWLAAALAATVGSLLWDGWAPAWLMIAMMAGVALPKLAVWPAVPLTAALAAWLQYRWDPSLEQALTRVFVVGLSGTTAAVLNRLLVANRELRRTREQLAAAAVARERDRVARDLHDALGHTLSVLVVKAAAVRRLIGTDPDAAAQHAADIETVGRTALTRVREVVHNAAPPDLRTGLQAAREALRAAGIEVTVSAAAGDDPAGGEPLAWALREGVTNVLRHSAASTCRIDLTRGAGGLRLTIADDGVGHLGPRADDSGGLAGLRRRLTAAGGSLQVLPGASGFTLIAEVPDDQ